MKSYRVCISLFCFNPFNYILISTTSISICAQLIVKAEYKLIRLHTDLIEDSNLLDICHSIERISFI